MVRPGAGVERAAALALFNDIERKPVLDRNGGIEELGLGVDRPAGDAEIVDADGRRITNGIDNAVKEPAASSGRSNRGPDRHGRLSQHQPGRSLEEFAGSVKQIGEST